MLRNFSPGTMKKLFWAGLCSLILSGCTVAPAGKYTPGGEKGISTGLDLGFISVPNTYKHGLPYVSGRLNDDKLRAEYNEWVGNYVVLTDGGWTQRIRRDASTDWDTVSEGLGYGMLLAAYFNDQSQFWRLYNYVVGHTNKAGLMHWRISKTGVNIDEVGYPVPHNNLYTNGSGLTNNSATSPGAGWGLLLNARNLTSATDADVDIAFALAMAGKLWGGEGGYDYKVEARKWISNIMKYEMRPGWGNTGSLFIAAGYYTGGAWGGGADQGAQAGWNPSYYTPAYYPVFQEISGDPQWGALYTKMSDQMSIVAEANNGTGLFPDWCNTASGLSKVTTSCSDRGPQSYNFYYDAVRVPWRLAVAASWFNDPKALLWANQAANYFKNKFYANAIVDGYQIDGSPWSASLADPVSAVGGINTNGTVFLSMIAPATLPYGDMQYANDFYQAVVNSKISYASPYHYFGNTLRLLSLLYMSGEFINIFDTNNYMTPTVNPIPGLINAENYIATNGYNLLQNIAGFAALTNGASYLVSNTMSTYKYSIYSIEYRAFCTNTFISYGPNPGAEIYIMVDGAVQGTTTIPNTGGAWMTFSNTIQLTPGNHVITVGKTTRNIGFGSMKVSFIKPAPIVTIPGSIPLSNFAIVGNGVWKGPNTSYPGNPYTMNFSLYNSWGQFADFDVIVPGVPGSAPTMRTIKISIISGGGIALLSGTNVLTSWSLSSSTFTNLTTNVLMSPGLQTLRLSCGALVISNLTIN